MKKENANGKIIVRISIIWIFVLAIIIASITSFFKNDIFATDNTEYKENTEKVLIEENQNVVDILEVMVQNNYSNTMLVNEERNIKFEIEVQKTDKLPKGEEKVQQKGVEGKEQVTALQTYENGNLINEDIIESKIKEEPIKEIVYEGTSEFLSKYSVHIGDEMYLIEPADIKKEKSEESDTIYNIKRYLNVSLMDIEEDWAKIKYKDYEGYIQIEKLTSESVTPKIAERNRIAKLQSNLNLEMDLNKKTGLTLEDYKTIFNYNESDINGIFSENAQAFYELEQKHNINGIFLAAIGIHESAWGTSTIAKEKYNLFGYRAYDRDPEKNAQDFESYEECIETVAEALANNYLSSNGSYYNGNTIQAVNIKYASDKNWATKIYAYMEYLYGKLV